MSTCNDVKMQTLQENADFVPISIGESPPSGCIVAVVVPPLPKATSGSGCEQRQDALHGD